jgi:hypothetical protein
LKQQQAFVSSLVFPAYLRLGVEFKPDDQPMTKFSRISLTAEACNHGHRPCIHQSQDYFEEWMNSPDPITFNGSLTFKKIFNSLDYNFNLIE